MEKDTHSVLFGYIFWLFGFLGAHRFYLEKWITAILYLFTGGFFLIGYLYDLLTLNSQIAEDNQQ
ncbi:MAG: TM2 domain-containing protein [gamma proteobacterium symbiont of Taylorina sp.]|nr:TM2 domain-containing protein [gamma proteobacterium symbiont of Taylorina sp.]